MASTPPNIDAFKREVDEELRREQIASVWRRWGLWIVGAIFLGLAIFGGVLWWNISQTKKSHAEGEAVAHVFTDMSEGRSQDAEKKLKPFTESDIDGYRAAAKLATAGLRQAANDSKSAIAGYKAVAEDESLAKPYRDLALIRWTAAEYDSMKPQDVVTRLKPLAVKGNPWFGSAGEMVAIAYLNLNKPELAGPLFAAIANDEAVPESIRRRTRQMAGLLGVDAVAQPDGEKK
ncbi:tetratricopeptide repeat protein [Sphingomonas colocasiae]|uniref:Tetratricopeptide repeat protein n=1 Tax=Sphingomonas colocasiae TaxID=1848973 RepID=A0ABS7PQN8_9SPHN|nr:tetratricopeptide repeat protein [Sphingomonas colocasiae]